MARGVEWRQRCAPGCHCAGGRPTVHVLALIQVLVLGVGEEAAAEATDNGFREAIVHVERGQVACGHGGPLGCGLGPEE